ncbi:FMN reductase [Arthrobacter sp. zg-Y40]|uniref:FMN reductase n=1 Tax=Arthrobacter sp. zg-Y40 TaxID=2886939 RepID=UPI001D136560|nr:FMN reductase [Arthrobacter sp. zg-Y40]MCC3280451.1 FMN reductase [Arthrobacter sp. zg-Y40]
MTQLMVVTAGLGDPSSSRMLADQLSETVVRISPPGTSLEVDTVELRDHALDVAGNFITGYPAPKLAAIIDRISRADALIVVSPVFSGSYSGLFKSFFDLLDTAALARKPVLLAATGGSPRHALMLEHAMRPLFIYLRATVMPTAVYASPEDWGAGSATEQSLETRVQRASAELIAALQSIPEGPAAPANTAPDFDTLLHPPTHH